MGSSELVGRGPGNERARTVSLPQSAGRGHHSPSWTAGVLMVFNDVLVTLAAFVVALSTHYFVHRFLPGFQAVPVSFAPGSDDSWYLLGFLCVTIYVLKRYGLYTGVPSRSGAHETRLILQACLTSGVLLCGWLYLANDFNVSRILIIVLVAMTAFALSVRRAIWRTIRFRQYAQGIETRNVVILGTSPMSWSIGRQIEEDYHLGYRLVGFLEVPGEPRSETISPDKVLGEMNRLRELTRLHFIDELVITEHCPVESVLNLLEEARDVEIDIRAISGLYVDLAHNAPLEYLGVYPVVALHRTNPRTMALLMKRTVDIAISLLALIAVFPIMLLIALAVIIDSPGPIFYVSERIGKRGRVFPCFKFRTMVKDAEAKQQELEEHNERDGILFKMTKDPRITGIGRFLRKYSLDELPQFFNVLRGEMSIVGPRPPIASEVANYALEHFRRLEVMPGLTGLWQIQARHDSSFARYIALDTAYVENWSFWLDLKILLRTAAVVIRGTGT
jgi:exopolysaccharide biosynthesis polyprenyl glycosylphosphotransferase